MKVFILVLFSFFWFHSMGQEQKELLLNEDSLHFEESNILKCVTITGWRNTLTQKHSQSPDLQTATDKILGNISGVTMIRRGNFAMEPTVRGLNAAQINTTIDGMQMFGACTDRMDPISSYVEANNLQNIQVSFGPNENQFGATIGGGFNFLLQKALPDSVTQLSGNLGVGYETNANAIQTIASLQYAQSKYAIGVNAVFRKAGNYFAGDNTEISFSQYTKWNLGLNGTYLLSQHHSIGFDYLQDEGYDIGYPALTMDVAFAKAKIGAINHIYLCGHKKLFKWENKIYYNFIDHAMDDTKRPKDQVPMHMDMPGTSGTAGFISKAYYAISNNQILTLQASGFQNKLHAEMTMYPDVGKEMFMLTIPDARRSNFGIEVKDKLTLYNNWSINTGMTFNYAYSDIFTELGEKTLSSFFNDALNRSHLLTNGFIQTTYKHNSNIQIFGGIARGARAPSIQDLYAFYLYNRMDGYDYIGNIDLKQETSWNANLGFALMNNKLLLEPQAYVYYFNNYVIGHVKDGYSPMTIGAKGIKQYSNIDHAMLYGFELAAKYSILDNLMFSSQNSVSYGLDNLKRPLPLIPPFKSINKLDYRIKGYQLYVENISQAKQNKVSSEAYGELPSMGFSLWNLGAHKNFKVGNLHFNTSLTVENVFDIQYYEHLDIMKIYRPGRNIITHITLVF